VRGSGEGGKGEGEVHGLTDSMFIYPSHRTQPTTTEILVVGRWLSG